MYANILAPMIRTDSIKGIIAIAITFTMCTLWQKLMVTLWLAMYHVPYIGRLLFAYDKRW